MTMMLHRGLPAAVLLLLLGGCSTARISTYARPGHRTPIARIRVSVPSAPAVEAAYLAGLKAGLEEAFRQDGVTCEDAEAASGSPIAGRPLRHRLEIEPLDAQGQVKVFELAPQLGTREQARFLCTLTEAGSPLAIWTGLVEISWTGYRLKGPGTHPRNPATPATDSQAFAEAVIKDLRSEGFLPSSR